jgi:hypothetical protein
MSGSYGIGGDSGSLFLSGAVSIRAGVIIMTKPIGGDIAPHLLQVPGGSFMLAYTCERLMPFAWVMP